MKIMDIFSRHPNRPVKAIAAAVSGFVAFSALAIGIAVNAPKVDAGVCDSSNIIHCGLSGTTKTQFMASLKNFYTSNDDGAGHTDIQSVFNWSGFSPTLVNGINTSNTKLGYIYKNGDVKVGDELVGTSAVVTTRLSGTGRTLILPGVYSRPASMNYSEAQSVLVVFDQKGQAISGVMTLCGNSIKFISVKRALSCIDLKVSATGKLREYLLTASSQTTNMTVTGYRFSYGDGGSEIVTTANKTASIKHTYPSYNKTYTAKVTVAAKNTFGTATDFCTETLTTPNPAISIDKKVDGVDQKSVNVGQTFVYELTVKNTGNMALTNALVSDKQPVGVTFLSADKGTIASGRWTYTIPSLAVGQSQAFKITAKVNAYVSTPIPNTACVNTPEVVTNNDPAAQDDCDDATVTVSMPVYTCDSLTLTQGQNRTVTAQLAYTAKNGAVYKNTTLLWGDSKQSLVTGVTGSHQYAVDGTYTVKANMLFTVAGVDVAPAVNPNCAKSITIKTPAPAVTITKDVLDSDGRVEVNQNYDYRVVVKNTGNIALKNVVVTDTPAAGSNIQLVSANGVGNIANNTWTYTIPSLAVGESKAFTLTAKVTAYKEGNLVNNACVNAPEVNPGNPGTQDDCDDAVVTVPKPMYQCNDITVTKGIDRSVVATVTYTANNGAVYKSTMFTWGDGQQTPTSTASASHRYGTDGTYTVKATMTFTVNGVDKIAAENPACSEVVSFETAPAPAVTITKDVLDSDGRVEVNQNYDYRVVVKNTGNIALKNVVVTDTPAAGSNIQLVSANGVGNIANNTWTYTIPSLAVGESKAFTLTAKVTAYKEGNLVNNACVNAPEVNPGNPGTQDDCDDAVVTVTPPLPKNPNITITKYVGSDSKTLQVAPYATYNYRLIVKNTGEIDLKDVVLTDTPDDGVTLLGAAQGTVTNNTWRHTIPSLAIGQEVSFTLTAKVEGYVAGSLNNKACVNASEINTDDPDSQDACDTADVTITPPVITQEKPQVLPNTGAGSVVGLFGLVSILGAIAYRLLLSRRLARNM